MRFRTLVGAVGAGLGLLGFGTAAATAAPDESMVNCGAFDRNPPLELINYNSNAISCPDATAVMNRFYDTQQKHATVDSWACSVLGAAEGERLGGVAVRCRGDLGELRLQKP